MISIELFSYKKTHLMLYCAAFIMKGLSNKCLWIDVFCLEWAAQLPKIVNTQLPIKTTSAIIY